MRRWIAACLLLATAATAMDPPELLWERQYFTDRSAQFYHAIQTLDGGFAAAAGVTGYTEGNRPLIKMDENGNIEWYAGNLFNSQSGRWVLQLPDSSYVVAGVVREEAGGSYGVYLFKVDTGGSVLWTHSYDFTSGFDFAWCVTPLPDGGFAVCGEYDEYDAFVMRTDANGDSLWTTVFDTGHAEKAFRVLYYDGGLTLYVDGGQANGPMLVRYDMDGQILWQESYGPYFPFPVEWGGDICLASNEGYMIASSYLSEIGQTDWEGNLLWHELIPGDSGRCGLSLQPTMDGGYIFSGWEGLFSMPGPEDLYAPPADTGSTKDGWLVKLDAEGNADWVIHNGMGSDNNTFYSACQLQGGGYIVAGKYQTNGYLLRYAPETGIGEGTFSPPSLQLDAPVPNPSAGYVGISYEVPTTTVMDLAVYDLSGRRVTTLVLETVPAGSHEAVWDPGYVPSGCYLVVLRTEEETLTRTCVLIR